MVDRQLRRRGIADERVLAAMGRCRARPSCRWSSYGALRRRRAPDRRGPDDLATLHRRGDVRAARAGGSRARARRRHRIGLRSRRARRARGAASVDRADRRARRSARGRARDDRPRVVEVRIGDGRRSPRSCAVRRDLGRRRDRARAAGALRPARRRRAECFRAAAGRAAARPDRAHRARPRRDGVARLPLRAARGDEARRASTADTPPRRPDPDRAVLSSTMDERTATSGTAPPRGRVDAALRRRANWEQLVKFCVVGATGYVVNLAVYTLLLRGPAPLRPGGDRLVPRGGDEQLPVEPALDVPRPARPRRLPGPSLPRRLDARARREPRRPPPARAAGLGEVVAQAIAIMLVTPVNFVGNKLWSFRHRR